MVDQTMIDVGDISDQLAAVCKARGVRSLALFGSSVRDDRTADSDVDVLVSFDGSHDLFNRYMGLLEDLRALFGRDVDLVIDESIRNPVFRDEVMAQKRSVYVA